MTLQERLKSLRREIGLSQEAIGAQGFVSTPGWIKVENGQRMPSDQLLMRFVHWLLKDQYVAMNTAGRLMEELLTLKYLGSRSAFIRKLAGMYAEQLSIGSAFRLAETPSVYRTGPRQASPKKKQG